MILNTNCRSVSRPGLVASSSALRFLSSLTPSKHRSHVNQAVTGRCCFSTGIEPTKRPLSRVAVIGGGPSGLSCAHYLKKRASELGANSITLFEGSDRLGGWIRSQTLLSGSSLSSPSPTTSSESFLFDAGPRSLRGSTASALYTIRLIEELGLQNELISGSSASGKRIIYVDGKLQELSLMSRLGLQTLIPAVLSEIVKPKRKNNDGDESIHSFFSRRFSVEVADVMASALTLGIFGGNAKTLSIRTCFPMLYDIEREHRSVLVGMMISSSLAKRRQQKQNQKKEGDLDDSEFVKKTSKHSIFSFKTGLEALTKAIGSNLSSSTTDRQAYQTKMSAKVLSVSPLKDKKGVQVTYSDESGAIKSEEYDHVISSVPAKQLGEMIKQASPTSSQLIRDNTSMVSLAVVNLAWSESWRNWPQVASNLPGGKEGGAFGYLVPPREKQPILGTVFDSETFPQQNLSNKHQTRLTVMLGGAAEIHENVVNVLEYENNTDKLGEIALSSLERHIRAKLPTPKLIQTTICRDAIPQYPVGYHKFLLRLDRQLATDFGDSLSVIGNSFGGIGVNDCIASGYRVVERLSPRSIRSSHASNHDNNEDKKRVLLDLL